MGSRQLVPTFTPPLSLTHASSTPNTYNTEPQSHKTPSVIEVLYPVQLSNKPPSSHSLNMQIKVRTLTGKEIELDIEPDYQVKKIKERVEEKEGIPPAQQRLIYGGKQMNDDKTAAEYSLEGGATLHLVLALRGGQQ